MKLSDLFQTWPGRVDASGAWVSKTHLTADSHTTLCGVACDGGFWWTKGVELDGRFVEPEDDEAAASRLHEIVDCGRCLKVIAAQRTNTTKIAP